MKWRSQDLNVGGISSKFNILRVRWLWILRWIVVADRMKNVRSKKMQMWYLRTSCYNTTENVSVCVTHIGFNSSLNPRYVCNEMKTTAEVIRHQGPLFLEFYSKMKLGDQLILLQINLKNLRIYNLNSVKISRVLRILASQKQVSITVWIDIFKIDRFLE